MNKELIHKNENGVTWTLRVDTRGRMVAHHNDEIILTVVGDRAIVIHLWNSREVLMGLLKNAPVNPQEPDLQ